MADNVYDTNAEAPQTNAYTPVAGGASDSPFSFGGDPNAPGMFGMSRGFWRDVASWSANLGVAANARTAGGFLANGTGFLGPVAAATQETLAQGVKNATAQAALNQSGATTVDLKSQAAQRNIQNKVNLFNLNRSSWLYGGPQFDENGNPLKPGQTSPYAPFQDDGQTPPQSPPQSQSSVTLPSAVAPQSAADKPNQNYAGLYGNPTEPDWASKNLTTVTTPGGAKFTVNKTAAPAFQGFLGELEQQGYKINPDTSGGYNLRNVTGGSTLSPHAYGVAIDVNPTENPYSKTPEGGALTTNLPPNVSQLAAKYGLQWGGNWKSLKDPMHFEYVGGKPVQVAQAGNVATDATPTPGAPTSLAPPATGTPAPAPSAAATQISQPEALRLSRDILTGRKSLSSLTPQQAGAIAPMITMVDKDLGAKLSTFALSGPQKQAETAAVVPEGYRQTPQGLMPTPGGPHDPAIMAAQKAAEAKAQALNSNLDVRPDGLALVQQEHGPPVWVRGPHLENRENPDGSTTIGYMSPPSPDAPPGTPGTFTPAKNADGSPAIVKIPTSLKEAYDDAFKRYQDKSTPSYVAAQGALGQSAQIEAAAEKMEGGSMTAPGPTAPARLHALQIANDIGRAMRLGQIADPASLAGWEELRKASTTLGFQFVREQEGASKQAATTIMQGMLAVPHETNSPEGLHIVNAGVRAISQMTTDLHDYKTQIVKDIASGKRPPADLVTAEDDFFRANTPQMYVDRANSSVHPLPTIAQADAKKYEPGTFFWGHDGKLRQIPEREGSPAIPGYLRRPPPGTQ